MESLSMLQMFQSPFAAAELGANPFAVQLPGAQGMTTDSQFADVLGLVSDLEIADAQSPQGIEAFTSEMLALGDNASKDLEAQGKQAQLDMATSELMLNEMTALTGQNIGRPTLTPSGEMTRLTDVAANLASGMTPVQAEGSLEARLLEGAVAPAAPAKSQAVNGEALKQWALAFSRNEIKAVEVEQGGDGVSPRLAAPMATGATAASQLTATGVAPNTEKTSAFASDPLLMNEAPLPRDSGVASAKGSHAQMPQAPIDVKIPDANTFAPARPEVVKSTKGMIEPNEGARVIKADAKPKAVSGADFLLDKTVDTQGTSTDFRASYGSLAAGLGSKPALDNAAALGGSHDTRIQPQNLDFVADKVSELKASGGGRLRVELTPEGMGSIEIKVGMVGGQMKVQLTAEKPETLMALEGSRGNLMDRLSTISDAKLEIGRDSGLRSSTASLQTQKAAELDTRSFASVQRNEVASEKPALSHDFMKSSIDANFSADRGAGAFESRSFKNDSNSSGFGRDGQASGQHADRNSAGERQDGEATEGRDRAYEKWATQWADAEKRSA